MLDNGDMCREPDWICQRILLYDRRIMEGIDAWVSMVALRTIE